MDIALSAADAAFRDEVRDFLAAHLNERLRRAARLSTSVYADRESMREWHEIVYRKGWIAPSWPVEYGGCGWSVTQRYIYSVECARASTPGLSPMGLAMCGPMLIGYGTEAQKAAYLPRILSGEDFWCQGYSEPGSGSDLASLQMAAVDDGDDLICTGQKIWTTHANYANRIFCLVRTSREEIPQKGITFLLIDMDQPGVRVDPLIMMSGEHIQNQVFFTDVRVPKANVVGKIGQGWTVAKYLLEFERGGNAYAPGLAIRLDKIRAMAAAEASGDGGRLIDEADFQAKIAAADVAIKALEFLEHRLISALSLSGGAPGPQASIVKTRGTELSQHLTELGIEAAGAYGVPFQPGATCPGGPIPGWPKAGHNDSVGPDHALPVMSKYLNDRAGSIYGGSNEIQRNIMAKAVLGL
ncbi:Putative acyl-CoA dehydrogenase FadE17 [Alphaproteobacteria bacterium SO-S41]|nr:Putative acyl-CoA dehydrogenase FadE17 [Alphaproteobacteria bacterium SO-S41]